MSRGLSAPICIYVTPVPWYAVVSSGSVVVETTPIGPRAVVFVDRDEPFPWLLAPEERASHSCGSRGQPRGGRGIRARLGVPDGAQGGERPHRRISIHADRRVPRPQTTTGQEISGYHCRGDGAPLLPGSEHGLKEAIRYA